MSAIRCRWDIYTQGVGTNIDNGNIVKIHEKHDDINIFLPEILRKYFKFKITSASYLF